MTVKNKSGKRRTETKALRYLLTSAGRASDKHWKVLCALDEALWREIPVHLQERRYTYERATISVRADVSGLARAAERHHESTRRFYETRVLQNWRRAPVAIVLDISAELPKGTRKTDVLDHEWKFAEHYFHELFLILNIATPGSCDFYRLRSADKERPHAIELVGFRFDWALEESLNGDWPRVEALPTVDVVNWYDRQRFGLNQLARTRAQRVLFDMLNLSKDSLSPAALIWLFHALEGLFRTEIGESKRKLVERVSLLLNPDAEQKNFLKSRINALYELRSKIVHGGFDAWHPSHNEALDPGIHESYRELMDACDFAFRLVLASVQSLIKNGWDELAFRDNLVGVTNPLPPSTLAK